MAADHDDEGLHHIFSLFVLEPGASLLLLKCIADAVLTRTCLNSLIAWSGCQCNHRFIQ